MTKSVCIIRTNINGTLKRVKTRKQVSLLQLHNATITSTKSLTLYDHAPGT